MKAFVTGGTGFIGSHLVDALLTDDSNEVRCLVRSKDKWLTGKNVKKINGDMHDLVALKNGLDGVDVVFHLAALVKAPKKEILLKTNVEATENLIRMAQKSGVGKIVILSSLAAAGPSFSRPLNEQDPLMPVSMYGESKKRMEEMIHTVAQPDNSITILRPPAVYGPREEQIYSFFKICSKGFCPIIGSGDKTHISMVHVSDVVHGLQLAADQKTKGVHTYFVSSEEVYNWNRIRKATSIALNRKLLPIYIKPNIVKGLGTMLESVGALFGQYPVMNKDKALEMTHEWTCSVDAIKKDLGYTQQMPLEEGLFHTISWYKKHNWI